MFLKKQLMECLKDEENLKKSFWRFQIIKHAASDEQKLSFFFSFKCIKRFRLLSNKRNEFEMKRFLFFGLWHNWVCDFQAFYARTHFQMTCHIRSYIKHLPLIPVKYFLLKFIRRPKKTILFFFFFWDPEPTTPEVKRPDSGNDN